jgi:multicomponent Na+:H+ antiporter subunit D
VNVLLGLPVVLPILGAAVSILSGRSGALQRIIGISVLTVNAAIAVALVPLVDRDGIEVSRGGGWRAPMGIMLVADRLSAILLAVAALMLLAVLVFAIGQPGVERNHVGFQSTYLVLAAGISASFLSGDLFTLFVAFEITLTASYVLITMGGRREQVRTGMTYVTISLIASALFVIAVALVYSSTGTVNLADLSGKMAELPPGTRNAFALLILVVFGIKAALFPLFFWLPDSYPSAPSPVTAIFAGLLTKLGVYAIIRSQTLLFPESSRPADLILFLAGATMVIGILGAIAQGDVKRILSFNIVSKVGYMVMGLGLFTVAGLAAGVFYTIHHIVVTTALFLAGGLIEHVAGSSRLATVGGLVRTQPVIAVLFLLPALSLAGIPPFSGFIGKMGLVEAGIESSAWIIVGVALAVSLLTLLSMLKIWIGAFWSPAEGEVEGTPHAVGRLGGPAAMVGPTAALVALSLAIAVLAGPLYDYCERTAADLLDTSRYVAEVLAP